MKPSESHAWFRAATASSIRAVNAEGIRAAHEWRLRLHDYQERCDLREVAPRICPNLAALAAARVSVELGIIVAVWPERPDDALRPSWE